MWLPLQDLMEHDPVEEAAETEIQQYPEAGNSSSSVVAAPPAPQRNCRLGAGRQLHVGQC
jgi:hypothetical protein